MRNNTRDFSFLDKITSKVNLSFPQSKDDDINIQIRDLDSKKLKLTFNDIFQDYKNFRSNYYFYQMESPKDRLAKMQVDVDTKSFKIQDWLVDFFYFRHGQSPLLSAEDIFTKFIMIISLFLLYRLVRKPYEWYYHWDDPLQGQSNKSLDANFAERLKHKKKIRKWWTSDPTNQVQ
eukprot:403361817